MNTEEKKPIEGEQTEDVKPSKQTQNPAAAKSVSRQKNTLPKNAMIAIIAGAAVLLIAAVVLTLVLTGVIGGKKPDNSGGGNGQGGGNVDAAGNVSFTVSLTTAGGMKLTDHPVYIRENDANGEIVAYAATDDSGNAALTIPANQYDKNKNYVVVLGTLEGYNTASSYPLVGANLPLIVSSQLLPDIGFTGLSYEIGDVMHDFSVKTTTGTTVTLSELLKEKEAVLLNFWFSECGPCQSEFPFMQAAYEKYQDKLAIIALNPPDSPSQDSIETIRQFKDEYGLTFDVAQDPNGAIKNTFGVQNYPVSVMIDRYGVVCVLEEGAITSEYVFDQIFSHFTADNYQQKLIYEYSDIVPPVMPDVDMPSSDEISNIFDKGNIPGITYLPYRDDTSESEKEYSWPFIIGEVEVGGQTYDVIQTSNSKVESSFCQMVFNVDLKKDEVLAFDYYSVTELGSDILYVIVNDKDIYSISGQNNNGWETCYSYVAEADGTYEVALVYLKDNSTDHEIDAVYLKNLRIVGIDDIDSPTYIFRYAVSNPDFYGGYDDDDYVKIFMGSDGYYHVDSATGPLLLANLMGFSRFSETSSAYIMITELYEEQTITLGQYNAMIDYCNYAANSDIYGVTPVTDELIESLKLLSPHYGDPNNDKDWIKFCCYYDAYGTNGEQLEDPIKGLASFSAYDVIVSENGDEDFPNSFTYNKVIMPRGLISKFTPTVSGVYIITSKAPDPANEGYDLLTEAWIFTNDNVGDRETPWYTYENVDRFNSADENNCRMIVYLEAGKDYYIDIAYSNVYQEGTISYRVERLGDEGYYRFSIASPGYFTTTESSTGDMTSWIIHGGINVKLGDDGIWREERTDGREGSILYADFTMSTPIINKSIYEMIEMGAFNFSISEDDEDIVDILRMYDGDIEACREYLKESWGEYYEENAEKFKIDEVFEGIYHGDGEDYTEEMKEYYNEKLIVAGYNADLDEVISEGDERIGCVIVDARLSEILQLLMDKYTFMNGTEPNTWSVENSWTKLCYYSQYFCAATPN